MTRNVVRRVVLCSFGALSFGVIILLVVQHAFPQRASHLVKKTYWNATRPLDVVIMLDASGSINAMGWKNAVEFARRVALLMEDIFETRNASLRVALGQFSTSAAITIGLRSDVRYAFEHLTTWECSKPWDGKSQDMCANDTDEVECLENPSCIARRKGFTEIGAALCGPRPELGERTLENCKGGAMGELWFSIGEQHPQPVLDAKYKCKDPRMYEAVKSVLLVTDGRPMTPDPKNPKDDSPRGMLGTKDAVAAARLVKNLSESTTIVGVMVGPDASAGQANNTLRALSSCCPAGATRVAKSNPTAASCSHKMNSTCPYNMWVRDFDKLLTEIEAVVNALTRLNEEVTCEMLVEETKHTSLLSCLWILLLFVPALLILLLARCVAFHAQRRQKAADALVLSVMESDLADPIPLTDPMPRQLSRTAIAAEDSRHIPLLPSEIGGDADCSVVKVEDATRTVITAEASEAAGVRGSGTVRTLSGRKWAPVRHAYMVNGKPLFVDYGMTQNGCASVPPAAPTRARYGHDGEEDERFFFPEAAMAYLDATVAEQSFAAQSDGTSAEDELEAAAPSESMASPNQGGRGAAKPTEESAPQQSCDSAAEPAKVLVSSDQGSSSTAAPMEEFVPHRGRASQLCGTVALVIYAFLGTLAMVPVVMYLTDMI